MWTVNSAYDTNDGVCDSNNCTLRDAISVAQPGDTIVFSILSGSQTIFLGSALPVISYDLTITGPGADLLTVRANAVGFTVLTINSGVVNISGLTIAGGNADYGGGINNSGNLTLTATAITGNHANVNGGGMQNAGTLHVIGSTISGNSAAYGAGLFNYSSGASGGNADLTNTTISGNSATSSGSSISNTTFSATAATVALTNCTIAGNTGGAQSVVAIDEGGHATISLMNTILAGNSAPSLATSGTNAHVTTLGHNLASDGGGGFLTGAGDQINTNARLTDLGNYGGHTPTHLLALNSPAVDAGASAGSPATDQRGVSRPTGLYPDIGAVELNPLVVTSTSDPPTGTCGLSCALREAIATANADGTTADDIFFSSLFDTPQVIHLAAALPDITSDLTLNGPGATLLTVRRDTGNFAIFTVDYAAAASISGLTISNGNASGIYNMGTATITDCTISGNSGSYGGGISSVGVLVVSRSTISGNSANYGGGVEVDYENGVATLSNCTLTENTAQLSGGGLSADAHYAGAAVQVTNCTIANNTAVHTSGGGIYANNFAPVAPLVLKNTIIAGNVAPSNRNLDVAILQSHGNNLADDNANFWLTGPGDLINTDPRLATLSNYGGTMQTLFLKPGSPAIDAGGDSGAPATDQRGVARPQGAHVDIGAIESDGTLIFQNGFEVQ